MTEQIQVACYKLYDEKLKKMKTFHTIAEADAFVSEKKITDVYLFALVLDEVFQDDEATFKIYHVNYIDELEQQDAYLYCHVDDGKKSFSWTENFHDGSPKFETVNKCLKHWLKAEADRAYDEEYGSVSCTSCGDGGCIHCRPSWFI